MADDQQDPYASIAKPVDPYASIAKPIASNIPGLIGDLPGVPTPHPTLSPVASPLTAIKEFGKGFIQTIPKMIQHPLDTAASIGQAVTASGVSPGEAYPTTAPLGGHDPGIGANREVQNIAQQGQADQASAIKENPAYAAGGAASMLAASALTHKIAPVIAETLSDRLTPVEGENFTPRQAKSHAAVVAEGNAAGDTGYIPQQIANATSSKLRQIAADNKPLAEVIRSGNPEDAFAAHQRILQMAKDEIDQRHNAALHPVADTPVDMKPVQDAVKPTKYELEGMDEADAQNLTDLQERAGKIQTLKGLNEFRKQLSTEDTTLRNPNAQGKSALYPQAIRSLYKATRDHYYDQLEDATGQNFQADKRLEGNIIQEQRGAANASPRLTTAQAKEDAPQGAGANFADLLEGAAHGRGAGIPVVGAITERLRGTKLGQVQQHLQRFYSGLPERTPPPAPPKPQFSVQAQQLRNPQLQLPASVPANVETGPAAAPQPAIARSQGAPGFNVSPQGVAAPGAPPPATPSILTPEPDAVPQLPAQAGPEGAGIPSATPPTAPPLNQATASQRTNPPLAPNPQPTPATPAGFKVGPGGVPERLPAGELSAPKPEIKAPKTGHTLKAGDEITVNGRKGTVSGQNPKTGKVVVQWQ